MGNILNIDSDRVSSALLGINKTTSILDDGSMKMSSGFSSIQRSPNLSAGINKINNNIKTISGKISGIGNVISKSVDDFCSTEMFYCDVIDQIEIPTELEAVDDIYDSFIEQVKLDKKDGKAVEDEMENVAEYDDSYTEKEKELIAVKNNKDSSFAVFNDNYNNSEATLIDIKNDSPSTFNFDDSYTSNDDQIYNIAQDETESVEYIDRYTKIRGAKLKNIEKDDTELVGFVDKYSHEGEDLKNISTEGTEFVDFFDEYDVDRFNLKTIVKNKTEKIEFSDKYGSNKKIDLNDIKSKKTVSNVSYEDAYNIEETKLKNMNNKDNV